MIPGQSTDDCFSALVNPANANDLRVIGDGFSYVIHIPREETHRRTTTMLLFVPLLILLLLPWQLCFANDSLLVGNSFRVKTRISRGASPDRVELLLEEAYSQPQRKAKITYNVANKRSYSGLTELYYDAPTRRALIHSSYYLAGRDCSQVDLVDFYSSTLKLSPKLNLLMRRPIPKPDHIIGPARLILLVTELADRLKAYEVQEINGMKLISYNLDAPLFDKSPEITILVRVFYENVAFDHGSLKDQFPLFIECQGTWFNFSQLEIGHKKLDQVQGLQETRSPIEAKSSEIVMDEFAIPPVSGCLRSLANYSFYSPLELQSTRFSFEAETLDSSGILESHWIQFDGLLQALRVDSRHTSQTVNELKSSFFNFRTNRRFLVTGGHADDSEKQRQCLVLENLGRKRANLRLGDLIIGAENLSLIGRAEVRGIDASVFGGFSDRLPFWFDQPVLYQLNRDRDALRRRDVPAGSDDLDDDDDKRASRYKLLVYFADEKQVLALEVFDLNNERQRLLRVHFRDFAWHLTEAPDGRSTGELFALADICSAKPNEDHHLEINLLLRQVEVSAIADSSNAGSWIEDLPARDSALLAGLADSLDLDCTMIHDVESQIKSDPRLTLDVHFRLAERSRLLHSLKLIGPANLKPASNALKDVEVRHKGSAFLLTDCLSLVNAKGEFQVSPIIYVYYSEQHSACVIDPTLDGVDAQELFKSPLIQLAGKSNELASGELYQIETHLEHSDGANIVEVQKRLGRVMFLTHETGQPAQPIDPAVFEMRIERMKATSNNHLLDSETAGQKFVYPHLAYDSLEDDASPHRMILQGDDEKPATLRQCQTACLADYECKSFSFCVQFPGSECVLSRVSTREIGMRLNEISREKSPAPKTIQLQTHGRVRVRWDLRCELHQKSYLAQFIRQTDKEKNVLSGHWTVPVSSVEECALSCFMKTLSALNSPHEENKGELNKNHTEKICTRFLYLSSLALNEAQKEAIGQAIGKTEFDFSGHLGGFCLIKHNLETKRNNLESRVFFNFDYYEFDFTTLYEKTLGISLVDSSNELEKAAQAHLYNHEPSSSDKEILEKANKEGRNIQALVTGRSEQLCARKCLMQTTPLHPACKSFDVIRFNLPQPSIICLFNTKMASETELQHSAESSFPERWHYEPRWKLIGHATGYERPKITPGFNCRNQNSLIPTVLVSVGLVILAKISGLMLGVLLTEKFLARNSETPRRLYKENDDIAME